MTLTPDHIHIRCEDLDAAIDYYVKVFEGSVFNQIEWRGMKIVQLEVEGQRIFLSPQRQGDAVEPNSGKSRWGQ